MEAESSNMSSKMTHTRKKRKLEVEDDEKPKQPEAPTPKPQRKGNVGKLAGLISLPLDVLFEVSHLYVWVAAKVPNRQR